MMVVYMQVCANSPKEGNDTSNDTQDAGNTELKHKLRGNQEVNKMWYYDMCS